MPSTRPGPFTDLDREWANIGRSPSACRALARWAVAEPALAPFGSPLDVVLACRRHVDSAAENELVGALLRQAADPLAARAVLQAILPGLAARVWRWVVQYRIGRPRDAGLPWATAPDLAAEVLGLAVARIAALAGTSPAWPAMTLVDGTWRRVRGIVAEHRRWQQRTSPMAEAERLASPGGDPRPVLDRLALALEDAARRGVLPSSNIALVYCTRVLGYSPEELGSYAGPNAAAIRARRARAERALAPAC